MRKDCHRARVMSSGNRRGLRPARFEPATPAWKERRLHWLERLGSRTPSIANERDIHDRPWTLTSSGVMRTESGSLVRYDDHTVAPTKVTSTADRLRLQAARARVAANASSSTTVIGAAFNTADDTLELLFRSGQLDHYSACVDAPAGASFGERRVGIGRLDGGACGFLAPYRHRYRRSGSDSRGLPRSVSGHRLLPASSPDFARSTWTHRPCPASSPL